jgi:hypothetical protein
MEAREDLVEVAHLTEETLAEQGPEETVAVEF